MKHICVNCGKSMEALYPVWVFEMFQGNTEIYKIWRADLMQCPICKSQVVARFAEKPYLEHFETSFKDLVERIKNTEPENIVYWKE